MTIFIDVMRIALKDVKKNAVSYQFVTDRRKDADPAAVGVIRRI